MPEIVFLRTKRIKLRDDYTCVNKMKGKFEDGEYCVKYFLLKKICVKASRDQVSGCNFDTRHKFRDDNSNEYEHISRAEYNHLQKSKKIQVSITMLNEMDPLFMAMHLGIQYFWQKNSPVFLCIGGSSLILCGLCCQCCIINACVNFTKSERQ